MTSGFKKARFNMIEQQIRPWGVLDNNVLRVMSTIAREHFVPEAYQGLAYADLEIPLGHGEVMLAPKIAARLLQALAIDEQDRILEIGTGSGYVTNCLAQLGGAVISFEINPVLADMAQSRLKNPCIEIHTRDALSGDHDHGPFDAIAVTGSLPGIEFLARLQAQLTDGGRLFAIVGKEPIMQALRITRVREGDFRHDVLFETVVPRLRNVPISEPFTF
jgi:protein-L-isoaspartate(D-aspartate) O-methyltransferase